MTDYVGLWSETKVLLKAQMTSQTFDRLFAKTEAIGLAGDLLTVRSPNLLDLDWLNNRLADTVARNASRIAGVPLRVVFVNGAAAVEAPASQPVVTMEAPLAHHLDYDPRKRLWAKHPLIISRFYPAYFVRVAGRIIGSMCLPFWRYLVDQHDMSKSDQLDWTPRTTYQAGQLARALGCPITHLTGRLRTCHIYDQALAEKVEAGEVDPADYSTVNIPCCGHFKGSQLGETQDGRPACHYRIAGAMEVLAGEGWLIARRLGTDSRDTRFEIQVSRYPVLLTAGQVGMLSPELQSEYREFLRRDLGLDLAEWQEIETFEVGLAGLEIKESGFLMPKNLHGIDILMPAGNKRFFLPHNYSQQASKLASGQPPGIEGPPAGE